MKRIVFILILTLICLSIMYCNAQNQDSLSVHYLKLKNQKGVKREIKYLIKDGKIQQNDIIFISFLTIDEENRMYVFFTNQSLAYGFKLNTLLMPEYRLQPLKGYTKIKNHDCFIFGHEGTYYFQKTGYIKLSPAYSYITTIDKINIKDYYENLKDIHIESFGYVYKLKKNHFVKISCI